jgi:hypothetical protein
MLNNVKNTDLLSFFVFNNLLQKYSLKIEKEKEWKIVLGIKVYASN